jgi:hypothetical protein
MHRFFQKISPVLTAAFAITLLIALFAAHLWIHQQVIDARAQRLRFGKITDQTAQARERFVAMKELKENDMLKFKAGFSGMASSRKSIYETGLSLQDERRLLEKQLEIMTTYLVVNPALQRVFLMRGDQPLQGYLISHIPPKAYGGVPDTLPRSVRIISKERFAHPERGHAEEIDGRLQWTPPQVGSSLRSNALGQYVVFTNSKLILHGPPLNPEDHEKYPHICLGLDLETAKKLYRGTFIGTRIIVNSLDKNH